jgi:hypothetical protein
VALQVDPEDNEGVFERCTSAQAWRHPAR